MFLLLIHSFIHSVGEVNEVMKLNMNTIKQKK